MKSGTRCFVLFLLFLLVTGPVLAQGETPTATPVPPPTAVPKTPLPLPMSPVIELESELSEEGVEVGTFVISSSDRDQFADAESVDVLAINPSTRGEVELSSSPSNAGTFRVSAETLEYADGHIISFSMEMVAALDDPDFESGPHLIFCYPVYELCQDPATLVRSLPPPTGGTVTLDVDTEEGEEPAAQTAGGGSTFNVSIPLQGTVITQAEGIIWEADNSGNDATASGQQSLTSAQAQTVDAEASAISTVTIQFGAGIVGYESGSTDVVKVTVRARAPQGSNRYTDSHSVGYYYCEDPNDPEPDCEERYHNGGSGGGPGGDPGGPGGDGGDGGDGGAGSSAAANCLNTDAAAPIKVCANADYSQYLIIGVYRGGDTIELATVASSSALYDAGTAANDNLASGTNVAAGKSYTLSYDGKGLMTLSTFYQDNPPDVNKAYVITIDTHHTVRYLQW